MTTGITARKRLELSQLTSDAQKKALLGTDIDIEEFKLFLISQVAVSDAADRIVDGTVSGTIEGASTVTVVFNDYDRALLRSGILTRKLDVQIDGLWWRLASIDKSGDDLTLTFEDREVAVLRTYDSWRIVSRAKMTRAEFVQSMIREVKEFQIPMVIPALHKVQPIEKYAGDPAGVYNIGQAGQGVPTDYNSPNSAGDALDRWMTNNVDSSDAVSRAVANKNALTVKNGVATKEQIGVANIIMQVGVQDGYDRRLIVAALMAGITESRLINNPSGDNAHGGGTDDSSGVFQQTIDWGSYQERTDVATAARLFYRAVQKQDLVEPSVPLWTLVADVQRPRENLRTEYGKWQTEAERFLHAFGMPGYDSQNYDASVVNGQTSQYSQIQEFFFYRGDIVDHRGNPIRKRENTWSASQRLADEVDWRCFFAVTNNVRTFFFINESDLFKQQPIATINEFGGGIEGIDGNYDGHKLNAELKITARVGRWSAHPGSVVVLVDMGPFDGRWLVTEYSRPLLKSNVAEITIKKPRPQLPEPLNPTDTSKWPVTWFPAGAPSAKAPVPASISSILNNPLITFNNDTAKATLERSDIQFGQIDERVLDFLLWMTGQGYPVKITALKSDHSVYTSEGNFSAHGEGRAVDLGNYGITNPETPRVMQHIAAHMEDFGIVQIIGAYPTLNRNGLLSGLACGYDALTLSQHKDHIHVGWPLR